MSRYMKTRGRPAVSLLSTMVIASPLYAIELIVCAELGERITPAIRQVSEPETARDTVIVSPTFTSPELVAT